MADDLISTPTAVLSDVAAGLGEVLASVHRDELTCSPQLRHRIEGARLALLMLTRQRAENDRIEDT